MLVSKDEVATCIDASNPRASAAVFVIEDVRGPMTVCGYVNPMLAYAVESALKVTLDIEKSVKEKIALFCNVDAAHVIEGRDVNSIYEVPLLLDKQKLGKLISL